MSIPITAAVGTTSCNISSLFVSNSVATKLAPVMLPPARLKLATSPAFTGSVPLTATIGIEVVAAFGEGRDMATTGDDHGDLLADQVSREHRQSIVLPLRPTKFNRHVLTVDVTRFVQTFAKGGDSTRIRVGRRATQKPDHGNRRLLRERIERPRARRSGEYRDEIAPPHSITSSMPA